MTYLGDFTSPPELLEQIALQGFDFLPELIRIVVYEAMEIQRQQPAVDHHRVVDVDEVIPHAGHKAPWDFWMIGAERIG
jgi:hypothetical protein